MPDNAISPMLAEPLQKAGHDVVHVRQIGLRDADDSVIFQRAFDESRTIISADTDFGFLLSTWDKNKPSVIIFRKGTERNPVKQVDLLLINLDDDLLRMIDEGSLLIFEPTRIRIRSLPLFKTIERK